MDNPSVNTYGFYIESQPEFQQFFTESFHTLDSYTTQQKQIPNAIKNMMIAHHRIIPNHQQTN